MMSTAVFQQAELSPDHVQAGDNATFRIDLTIGNAYTQGPSRIIVDLPRTLGMSNPNRWHVDKPGLVDVYVKNPEVSYSIKLWNSLYNQYVSKENNVDARLVVIDFSHGFKAGDEISITWGDTLRGYSPGMHVTTLVPQLNYQSRILVKYYDSQEKGLPDMGFEHADHTPPTPDALCELSIKVHPQKIDAVRVIRRTNEALIAPLDRFWNVTQVDSLSPYIQTNTPLSTKSSAGVYEAARDIEVCSKGIALYDSPRMDDVYNGMNIYWGEIHSHSSLSYDCVGNARMEQTPAQIFHDARYRAGLDFFAVTDHHEPHHRSVFQQSRQMWEQLLTAVNDNNRPGEFLAFAGLEYRCDRGDTPLIFKNPPAYEKIAKPNWQNIEKVWEDLADEDMLSIPHFHFSGKLPEGMWIADRTGRFETVLEVFSCHGSYERQDALEQQILISKHRRDDRYAEFFLKKGYKYGFVCNSDGHKGSVGQNGLTAVYSPSLEKDDIFDAYRKRHVYGTTNARIRLLFTGNDQLMGTIQPNRSDKRLVIQTQGEIPLKKIELYKNMTLYKRFAGDGINFTHAIHVNEDEPSFWHARVTQIDNQFAVSSPIWYE